jgi:tape measure domain-containing protein
VKDIAVRLVIQADGSVAVRALDGVRDAGARAGGEVTARLQGAGNAAGGLAGRLDNVRGQLVAMAGAAAAAFATGQVVQAADAYTRMSGQIALVTDGSREFAAAQGTVFAIAQQTRAPLEATSSLYGRLSNAMEGTAVTAQQVATVTRTVNEALAVSGAGAQEAKSAILQLSQAFAAGRFAGEEFGAVNEAAPRLLKALAEELGVTRGSLKKMAEEGQLTSDVLVRAFSGIQASKIAEEFEKLPPTIAQAMTVGGNSVTRFIGEVDRATGASAGAAQAIIGAAGALDGLVQPAAAVLSVVGALAGPLALGAVVVGLSRAVAAGAGWIASQAAQVQASRLATAADSARLDMIASIDAARVRSLGIQAQTNAAAIAGARASQLAAEAELQRSRLEVLRAKEAEQALARQVRFSGVGAAELATAQTRVAFALANRERAQESVTAAVLQTAAAERAAAGSAAALTAAQTAAATSGTVAAAATGGLLASVRAAGAGLVAFLGGPWGALFAAVTVGATLWATWGDSGAKAASEVEAAIQRTRAAVEGQRAATQAALTQEQIYQQNLQLRQGAVERLSAAQARLNELLAMPQGIGQRGDFAGSSAMASASAEVQRLRAELQGLDAETATLNTSTTNWVRSSAQGFIDVMTAADPVAEAISRVRDAIRDANAEPVDLKARDAFGALVEDLKKQEQALREQIASAQGGAAAVAQLRAEQIGASNATAEQRAELERLTGSITTLEGSLDAARNATRGAATAKRDDAAAAREARAATDEYSSAMRQAAAQDVPALTRAALDQVAALERLQAIRARLAATGQLTGEREAALLAQETRERERYLRVVDQTVAAQQRSRAAVDALIPRIRAEAAAVGLSGAERERLSARLRAEEEMRRLVEAAIRDGNTELAAEAEALIANAGAAAEAAAAQGQVADAARQAAAESERYWGGFGDAVSSAVGEGLVNRFEGTADRLKDIFKRLLADMLTAAAANKIIIPIATALGIPTGGMQAGNLLQTILGGGGQGGGGLLGSIGNALGLGGTGGGGFLGNIASTVGGTVRSVLGSIIGMGGGTAAFAGGLGAIGTAGGAAGLGLAGLGGAGAGAGAFAGATAGGAAGLGLMGALSSIASVAGPIALAAVAINALAGGRLFGTSYQTNRSGMQLDIGADGASGYTFEEQSRRRALFQGTRRRTVRGELPDDAQQSIDDLFASIGQTVAAAAGALGIDVPPLIASSFRRTVDNKGNVLSEVGSILGRQYNESFESFSRRIAAENVIATIDRALGGTAAAVAESIGDAAGQAFEGGAAAAGQYGEQLEGGITTMLKGATEAVQGEASRIAERWRSDADLLADGAGLLLAAATDMRSGFNLLGDGTLTQIADLVEDLANEGEPLADAYARASASTQLYRAALELMGGSSTRVGEALVRQATAITEAAGGIERARSLFDGYFEEFYSAAERAQVRLAEAERRRNTALDAIGVGRGIGNDAFRAAFEAQRDTLTAAETVAWLEAAEAIRTFNAAMRDAQQAAGTGTVVDDGLSGRIASDVAAGATGLRGSAEEIGAFVAALRREGESAVEAYERLSAGGSMLTEMLAMLGVAFEGSAAQFAAAAAGVSQEFGRLAQEFGETYFTAAEQAARRGEIAQANYAAAIAAAGMAAEQLATREQIRAAVMQALAAGNTTLAEQLLRVASAFNQVEQAAGGAATGVGNLAQQVDEYGRPIGGFGGNGNAFGSGSTGSGLGFGGEGGNAGNGTANELERVRQALRDWWRDLTTGPLSPLTPAQQYAESLREWQATAAAAQAGDIEAARRLQSLSDGLLRQAQSYLGPGAAYTQLFNQVRGVVGQVAGVVDAGGSQIRPIDGLGDSAGRAASSLERLASAAGMAPGSLVAGLTDTIGDAIFGAGLRSQSVQLPGPRIVQLDRPAPGAQDLARPRPVSRPPVVAPTDQALEASADQTAVLLRQLIRAIETTGKTTVEALKQRPPASVTRHLMG